MASSQHSERSSSKGCSSSRGSNALSRNFIRCDRCGAAMSSLENLSTGVGSDSFIFPNCCGCLSSTSVPDSLRTSVSSVRSLAGPVVASTKARTTALKSGSSSSGSIAASAARPRPEVCTMADLSSSPPRRQYNTHTVTPTSRHSRHTNDYACLMKSARRPVTTTPPTGTRRSSSSVQFHEPSYTTGSYGQTYWTAQISPIRSAADSSSIRLWPILALRRRR
ncbi:hypothetical protein E2P81_ATG10117 [Venturia nashicola]|nr:hypothetical protein E2P81_ATG10117 [Venturia nashicola]